MRLNLALDPVSAGQLAQQAYDLVGADEIPLLAADRVVHHVAVGTDDEYSGLLAERCQPTSDVVRVEHSAVGIGQDRERVGIGFQMRPGIVD